MEDKDEELKLSTLIPRCCGTIEELGFVMGIWGRTNPDFQIKYKR